MKFEKAIGIWIVVGIIGAVLSMALPTAKSANNISKMQALRIVLEEEPYAEFVRWEPTSRMLTISIRGPMVTGTDAGCEYFSHLIKILFEIDKGINVKVEGEWIPSRMNPIDYEWSKKLTEGL